jgi:hypothetical protein
MGEEEEQQQQQQQERNTSKQRRVVTLSVTLKQFQRRAQVYTRCIAVIMFTCRALRITEFEVVQKKGFTFPKVGGGIQF